MDKPILIFGATGLLGLSLVRRLSDQGKSPVAMVHNRKVKLPPGVPHYQVKITDADAVSKAVHRFHPGLIINCAAYTDVDGCERDPERASRVNVRGAENVLNAAGEVKARHVFLSTDYVFDGHAGPYDEDAHPHPINVYGQTKHDAETTILNSKVESLVIRAATFIGQGTTKHPGLAQTMLAQLYKGKILSTPIDQLANVTDVPTLAAALITATELQAGGILHLGSRELISRYDLGLLIAEIFTLDTNLVEPVMYADLPRIAARPLNGGLDTTKAVKLLSFEFPTPREAVVNLKHLLDAFPGTN